MNKQVKSILNHDVLVEVLENAIDEERYTNSEHLINRLEAIIRRYKELNALDEVEK